MLLVLTYHRIVESPQSLQSFFDITAAELDQQLKQMKAAWGQGATPGDLQNALGNSNPDKLGVLVTFDDGTSDHYHVAAPVLERNGMRGVFFCSTNRLGQTGFLTGAQCQELQARGHAMESHSHDHKKFVGMTKAELHRQLAESRRALHELGLGRWNFIAVPGGYFDADVLTAARQEGYAMLRTLEWGYNRTPEAMRIQSITINRKTAGKWFAPLISPRWEGPKRAVYHLKEVLKNGRLQSLYFGVRDARKQ
jgi:peptidoglycan/xylan/chitin deacetylase (PgdA/CDA1 family)